LKAVSIFIRHLSAIYPPMAGRRAGFFYLYIFPSEYKKNTAVID